MKVESRAVSVSWIPAGSAAEWLRCGLEVGLADAGRPPVDTLPDVAAVQRLRTDDRFRAANILVGYAEFDDAGTATGWGYAGASGGVVGSTTVRLSHTGATFGGYGFPAVQEEPVVEGDLVHLAQTFGGRCGVPLPSSDGGPVLWQAPVVWTTLTLTLRVDGTAEVAMPGASAFPRHWVYDAGGAVVLGSGLTDQVAWVRAALTRTTPWGPPGSPAVVTASEQALMRQLAGILRAGCEPTCRDMPVGTVLESAGDAPTAMYVVLDGVLEVTREDQVVHVGAGAVLGEQEILGPRPWAATLRTLTPARIATVPADDLDVARLSAVAELDAPAR